MSSNINKANEIIYLSPSEMKTTDLNTRTPSADTENLQNLLNDLGMQGGGTLRLGAGTFIINQTLFVPSNVTIEGVGDRTILDGRGLAHGDINQRPFLLRASGNQVGNLKVSTDLGEGQTKLSVTGDIFEARTGRMVQIISNERQGETEVGLLPFKEEIQKIVNVDLQDGTIEIDGGLLFDYMHDDNLRAEIYEPVSNVEIKKLKIILGGVGSVHSGININYGLNTKIDQVTIDGAEHIGIQMTRTYLFSIMNSYLLNSTSPLFDNFNSGYGIAVISSSCYGRIEKNFFDNCRHGVTGGNHAPHHISVSSNICTNCRVGYALGCHEPCMYWNFNGNTIQGCASGINTRGMHMTISDNFVKNITGVGISTGGTSGTNLPVAKEYVITNNRITNTNGRAIELRGHFGRIEGAIIEKNTCIKTLGIVIRNGENLLITNNLIDQTNNVEDTVYGIQLSSAEGITLLGNHLIGARTHGVFLAECIDVNISNNMFYVNKRLWNTDNAVIRAAVGSKISINNNHFQSLTRISVFTTNANDIIFVSNIISSSRSSNSNTNFSGASNLISKDNIETN
ncbi:right-handed parallel beta-helix repeat-containing protein [Enterococcus mundtii]|uniref:Right handed beta helix domain-containing protein n=1 Tax=Enterococcus mundtii TaxID=53346 RepID=A0A848MVJ7_ENTMU|nr:right-handed parallel beta-helix repeat-containing protein [Enterococcus mundtii]NMP59606.1 hypothetical protein [Enterococcus mundtii]